MKRRTTTQKFSLVLAGAAVLAVAACGSGNDVPAAEGAPPTSAVAARTVSQSAVVDTSNLVQLAGLAHHVFVGQVLEQSGTKALGEIPETQFRVSITQSYKGDLAGDVVVNQQGGLDPETQTQVLVDDDPMLEVGTSYLFATRYLPSENWHTLVPVYGDVPLTDSDAAAVEANPQARSAQPLPGVIAEMQNAIAASVPFDEPLGVPVPLEPAPPEAVPESVAPVEPTPPATVPSAPITPSAPAPSPASPTSTTIPSQSSTPTPTS
ncbi:hypothetical protein [Rhodococcoides fascians]|uniref:hypothetical protein n=1 Tax=Rhodococcoides fascians TaxID=1828 RepID=UPI00069209F6|nr:hypothetical protein [Rhodococcus fascians]AMY56459.1 hypothetical protein A3L23_05161 [Rhodococcus fascians D188]